MSQETRPEGEVKAEVWVGSKGKKHLKTVREATTFQKEYLKEMREAVAKGEHLIFGLGPRELITSMGLYYILAEYYSAVIASKQESDYYRGILEQRGYFTPPGYQGLPLGYAFDKNPEAAPYGGLPRPTAVVIETAFSPVTLYELYARAFGCPFYFMDFARLTKVPPRWWESEDWGEPHMIDQWVEEYEGFSRFLEVITGKRYSETKLREHLERADETLEYYWKATELASTTVPAPTSVTDNFAEVSVYNYHQGSEWLLKHAKKYYEEIKERVDNGEAVCSNERVRLMWGLHIPIWFNLGFYNNWEESHGAVFVPRNYLAMAQGGIYHDRSNPLRALALRRHLRYTVREQPAAAAEMAVYAAKQCKVDGVIIPVPLGAHDGYVVEGGFIAEALERAGIPTLRIACEPTNSRDWDDAQMKAVVTGFIESLKPKK